MSPRSEISLSSEELQALTAFSVLCAAKVLPLFERDMPEDTRPRAAIEAASAFVSHGKRSNDLRMKGLAAYKASRQAKTPVAIQAAESATQAVGAAYLHPIFDARQVKHILGAAAHGAYALELDAGDISASNTFQSWVLQNTPTIVTTVLKRYPPAPGGGGRAGALLRTFDAALRTH
ncbi:MAG TPA: hypothetical protein VJ841_02775 [Candidatus Saccharimonadales bacterium]|nr:hypothetical protein [Candidatus Saccharimonadales bacterium]